ncbi:hypothetical protein BDR22DRAFT_823669 [Usnea florida]
MLVWKSGNVDQHINTDMQRTRYDVQQGLTDTGVQEATHQTQRGIGYTAVQTKNPYASQGAVPEASSTALARIAKIIFGSLNVGYFVEIVLIAGLATLLCWEINGLLREFGNQAYPILAEEWQSILEIGIPPYQENGDLSIDENDGSDDDVDIEAIDSLNEINTSVFEEQPENLTNSRPTAKDISALRKWRSWVTVETDKRRDIQTPDESLPSHAVKPWLSTAGKASPSGPRIKHWLSASIESLRQ